VEREETLFIFTSKDFMLSPAYQQGDVGTSKITS